MFQNLAKTNELIVEDFKIIFVIPKVTNMFQHFGEYLFNLVINKLFGLVIDKW